MSDPPEQNFTLAFQSTRNNAYTGNVEVPALKGHVYTYTGGAEGSSDISSSTDEAGNINFIVPIQKKKAGIYIQLAVRDSSVVEECTSKFCIRIWCDVSNFIGENKPVMIVPWSFPVDHQFESSGEFWEWFHGLEDPTFGGVKTYIKIKHHPDDLVLSGSGEGRFYNWAWIRVYNDDGDYLPPGYYSEYFDGEFKYISTDTMSMDAFSSDYECYSFSKNYFAYGYPQEDADLSLSFTSDKESPMFGYWGAPFNCDGGLMVSFWWIAWASIGGDSILPAETWTETLVMPGTYEIVLPAWGNNYYRLAYHI